MRNHLTRIICTAMLGCGLVACSDHPSIVEPRASVPALQQGGPPTPVEPGRVVDEGSSAIGGFPVLVEVAGKLKLLELPGGRTILVAPGFNETFTNGNTGTTLTLNVTGPIQNNSLPDGGTELVFSGSDKPSSPRRRGSLAVIPAKAGIISRHPRESGDPCYSTKHGSPLSRG